MDGRSPNNLPSILSTKPDLAPPTTKPIQQNGQLSSTGHNRIPPPWSTVTNPPWSTSTRPLSDIRELTEPSLVDLTNRNHETGKRLPSGGHGSLGRRPSVGRTSSLGKKSVSTEHGSLGRQGSARYNDLHSNQYLQPKIQCDADSAFSLELDNVPQAVIRPQRSRGDTGNPNTRQQHPLIPPPPPRGLGYTIRNRGHSQSPVKRDDLEENSMQRSPSRTFLRTAEASLDILDFPRHQHPRVSLQLHSSASLFVGGGSVEGHIRLQIDELERGRHRRQLAISRISVDLLGVEEMSSSRRHIFLNLATELIDSDNPPPHNMVESLKQISPWDPFWLLASSASQLPFMISLPLDVGPPPFLSKNARIRYLLCATALIRDQGKQYLVRVSQAVSVLSVYDPEKALMSLPSPLTASDEYSRHKDYEIEMTKVTAGLHRQVWISGTSIFVDVQVINNSKKTIKRIELLLERDILCYKHVAASTLERSASQARIFDSNERVILSKSVMKLGTCGWAGVTPHSSDTRTCDLEIPRGHGTIKCGKYFEVRYFLNVIVVISHSKAVTVQLPIVLIHMNSLDVVPNSVAQVAAAIEEKRAKIHNQRSLSARPSKRGGRDYMAPNSKTPPLQDTDCQDDLVRRPSLSSSVQGRAFAAPRKQSLDRMRQEAEELHELGKLLDTSPRKYFYSPRRRIIAGTHDPPQQTMGNVGETFSYRTPPSNRKARILSDDLGSEVANIRARLRRMRSTETARSPTSLGHNHQIHLTSASVNDPDHSASAAAAAVVAPPRRNRSTQSRQTSSSSSKATAFRELDVESPRPRARRVVDRWQDGAAAAGGEQRTSRFEGLNAASARRKMRSSERWKGGNWFGGGGGGNRGDEWKQGHEREREENRRMLTNWI